MKKYKKISGQGGRSTLEMVGVLTIMGILTIIGIAGYSKAMPKYKMSKLNEQTALIITNIRAAYSIKDNYDGLTTAAAIQMGAVPREMARKNADGVTESAYNAFSGHVFLTPAADNKSVFITMAGLPKNACVALASADWGGQLGAGLVSIGTLAQEEQVPVGEQLQRYIGFAEDGTIPLSPALASQGCSSLESKNAVVIQYH